MKPYYQSDLVTLYHGDCLAILTTLDAGVVGAVVTDPPYSSGGQFRGDRTQSTASKYLGSYNSTTAGHLGEVIGDSRDSLGWAMWATLWLTQCYRVTEPGGPCAMFTDWRQLPNASGVFQAAGWVWRGVVVWNKGGSCRPMSGRFAHQCEYAVWGTRGPIGWDYSRPSLSGCFTHHVPPSKFRSHQTEKPAKLMEDIVAVSMPDATVLDPFMGSGTTGVACVNTGRKFIGIEIDEKYCEIAARRIEAAERDVSNQLTTTGAT